MKWLPIDRDENGRVTDECVKRMFNSIPIAVYFKSEEDEDDIYVYKDKTKLTYLELHSLHDCDTHYIPIPKLEV